MTFGLYEPLMYDNIEYVTSPEIVIKGKNIFHPEGIFSEVIWPYSDNSRFVKLAGIDLSDTGIFIHPKVYVMLERRQKILFETLHGIHISFDFDKKKINKLQQESENSFTGLYAIKYIIDNLEKFKEILNPLLYKIFEKYKDKIFIRSVFVLPPALRDIQIVKDKVTTSSSPINSYYVSLLQNKNKIKNPYDILRRNMTGMEIVKFEKIQRIIQKIYDEQIQMLKSKEGHIRKNVVAKRVDFSARAVITVDSTLGIDKIKLPYKIIMKLAEPFIAYHIFKNKDILDKFREYSKEFITEFSFSNYVTKLRKGNGSKEAYEIIKRIIDEYIVGKYVVYIKRDPAIHMNSWQAFYFECHDKDVIAISPYIINGFNADFDGDQMAVFMPLTIEAQREAKELATYRTVRPGTGGLETKAERAIVLGMYLMTLDDKGPDYSSQIRFSDVNFKSLVINKQVPFNAIIKYNNIKMTYGRYIYYMFFRQIAIKDPTKIGVIRAKELNSHLEKVSLVLNPQAFNELLLKIKDVAEYVVNLYPITISPEELNLPDNIKKLKDKILEEENFVTAQERIKNEVMPKVKQWLKSIDSGLYYLVDSGARGSWSDIEQILIAKGYISDALGKILSKPITKSFAEGLEPQDVVNMGSATTKGTFDRSRNTRITGALERQLVYAAQSVMISESDCGTTNFLKVTIKDKQEAQLFKYRYTKEFSLITPQNVDKLVGQTVHVRSPMYCRSKKGICEKCYGEFWKILRSKNVGLIAAQSVGERGTQLIMKTFHTGGKAEINNKGEFLTDVYPELNQYITFKGQQLHTKQTIGIKADETECEIYFTDKMFFIKSGIFHIIDYETNEVKLTIDLDRFSTRFGIEIKNEFIDEVVTESTTNNVYLIRILKEQNDSVGQIIYIQQDMSSTVKKALSLLYAQRNTDNFLKLYNELFDIYKSNKLLSVHFEIIVSQMTRLKSNLSIPWRRKQNEPFQIISIKNIIYYEAPDLAIAFENINKGLDIALSVSNRDIVKGPLEKIAYNEYKGKTTLGDILKRHL